MKKRGIGMATMLYPMDPSAPSSATAVYVRMNYDGTVMLHTGAMDVGQGSNTYLAQIAGEVLGVGMVDIRVISADTVYTPYDDCTASSRVMYIVGRCVKDACEKARAMLLDSASRYLGITQPDKLYIENGHICLDTYPDISMSVKEAANYAQNVVGGPVQGAATFVTITSPLREEDGHGRVYEKHIYATHIAQVEVDTETGIVDVLKYVAVTDCGQVINPLLLEGQLEGGISQGIGYALTEELIERPSDASLQTETFSDYHIPTMADMPHVMVTDYVEAPDKDGPFGAKGASEPTIVPVAPAIANAVSNAIGIRFDSLPLSPEKVLSALLEQENTSTGEQP